MIRALLPLLPLLFLASPATAAERRVAIGSFDRLRVNGPFEVHIDTGRSPGGTITGDARAIDTVDVQVDGSTLVIQRGLDGLAESHRTAAAKPVVITLGTTTLTAVLVIAGGTVSITRMRGDRIDLSVTGAGSITVGEATGDALNAVVIGAGVVTVGGHVGKAKLVTNGPGTIDAGALDAATLFVRLDGTGVTRARARYTATVDDVGLGQVSIAGNPQCTVRAPAGGPVVCGETR